MDKTLSRSLTGCNLRDGVFGVHTRSSSTRVNQGETVKWQKKEDPSLTEREAISLMRFLLRLRAGWVPPTKAKTQTPKLKVNIFGCPLTHLPTVKRSLNMWASQRTTRRQEDHHLVAVMMTLPEIIKRNCLYMRSCRSGWRITVIGLLLFVTRFFPLPMSINGICLRTDGTR